MFGLSKSVPTADAGATATAISEETLRRIRSWQHPEVFDGNPVSILTQTLASCGRAAYLEACRELLSALRLRWKTRPGFNILTTVYSDPKHGWLMSIEPSPRKGEDCVRQGGLPAVHPIKFSEVAKK
jgi:hypothetical protein